MPGLFQTVAILLVLTAVTMAIPIPQNDPGPIINNGKNTGQMGDVQLPSPTEGQGGIQSPPWDEEGLYMISSYRS